MRNITSALAITGALCLAAPAFAENAPAAHAAPHWTYGGKEGPKHWGELAGNYTTCKIGQHQSPIDIKPRTAAHLDKKDFVVTYNATDVSAVNNGHTVQATPAAGSDEMVTFKGEGYKLAQFHFHHPSEHTVTGKSYPLEMHLVNTNASGGITVVGVFIKRGAENKALAPLFSNLPSANAAATPAKIDISTLLPKNQKAVVYSGSLTTPPCSEQVNWIVMERPIEMSKAQIAAFTKLFPDNHRPVQKLNKRQIIEE